MFKIRSSFIGDFKLGDNINHNLDILNLLYRHFAAGNEDEKRLLCKPIIITLVSIIEAALYDFYGRIMGFTLEGVQNIADSLLSALRQKQLDKLEHYISNAKKHDFFDVADSDFYDQLHELRKVRNRVHIQNENNHFERDESQAFNVARKVLAERALEKTLRTMASKYDRNHNFVRDFELPWNSHFPERAGAIEG